MRILILVPDLGTGAAYTAVQFRGALRIRHRPRIAGPAPSGPWPPLVEELSSATRLPPGGRWTRSTTRALQEAMEDVELVYAFKAHPWSLGLGFWAARRFSVPLAVHLDDWDSGWFSDRSVVRSTWNALRAAFHPSGTVRLRMAERLISRADLVTVSTRALRNRFGGTVVRQGVDASACHPGMTSREEARRKLRIPDDSFVVLFLGTPRPHKGIEDLIAAFHELEDPRALLLLVGVPPRGTVEDHPDVRFEPGVPFGDSSEYMVAADAFVVPQHPVPFAEHQFPAKLLHAMAFGLPVIATDVGDAREVLGGEPGAGLVIPPSDRHSLREALGRLRDDPALRKMLGAEARRRVEDLYGWDAMARQLDQTFHDAGLLEVEDGRG